MFSQYCVQLGTKKFCEDLILGGERWSYRRTSIQIKDIVSGIRPANISPLRLVEMITKTSRQWIALPSFDDVPFVRKNTRIIAKLKSQIRPIAASIIEQWCTPESAMRVGDFSYLSGESITGLIYLISNLRNNWGGARYDNLCDASPWNNTCRGTQETSVHGDNVITGFFWQDLDTCTRRKEQPQISRATNVRQTKQ